MKGHGFGLADYLNCKTVQENEKGRVWILQPHFIHHLRESYGEEVKGMQAYSTPGTFRFNIVRPTVGIEGINETMQSRYRSGVGMLLNFD